MTAKITTHPTAIPDVVRLQPRVFDDARGFFLESWTEQDFVSTGIDAEFVQDNHSQSSQGTLRGLHYQLTRPQGKLVRVVSGRVFDVAVDLRQSSPSFGKWVGVWLSDLEKNMLWIPPGFAHGFYVASPVADLLYKCTDLYTPGDDRTVRWDDTQIGIEWPIDSGQAPLLSPKDAEAISFASAEYYP